MRQSAVEHAAVLARGFRRAGHAGPGDGRTSGEELFVARDDGGQVRGRVRPEAAGRSPSDGQSVTAGATSPCEFRRAIVDRRFHGRGVDARARRAGSGKPLLYTVGLGSPRRPDQAGSCSPSGWRVARGCRSTSGCSAPGRFSPAHRPAAPPRGSGGLAPGRPGPGRASAGLGREDDPEAAESGRACRANVDRPACATVFTPLGRCGPGRRAKASVSLPSPVRTGAVLDVLYPPAAEKYIRLIWSPGRTACLGWGFGHGHPDARATRISATCSWGTIVDFQARGGRTLPGRRPPLPATNLGSDRRGPDPLQTNRRARPGRALRGERLPRRADELYLRGGPPGAGHLPRSPGRGSSGTATSTGGVTATARSTCDPSRPRPQPLPTFALKAGFIAVTVGSSRAVDGPDNDDPALGTVGSFTSGGCREVWRCLRRGAPAPPYLACAGYLQIGAADYPVRLELAERTRGRFCPEFQRR